VVAVGPGSDRMIYFALHTKLRSLLRPSFTKERQGRFWGPIAGSGGGRRTPETAGRLAAGGEVFCIAPDPLPRLLRGLDGLDFHRHIAPRPVHDDFITLLGTEKRFA